MPMLKTALLAAAATLTLGACGADLPEADSGANNPRETIGEDGSSNTGTTPSQGGTNNSSGTTTQNGSSSGGTGMGSCPPSASDEFPICVEAAGLLEEHCAADGLAYAATACARTAAVGECRVKDDDGSDIGALVYYAIDGYDDSVLQGAYEDLCEADGSEFHPL